jgi:hypothetical protein
MLFHLWPESIRKPLGDKFPSTYLCVDTEFSDNSPNGYLLEFGFAMVRDGEPVMQKSVVLNWYDVPGVSRTQLDYRLGRLSEVVPGWRFTPRYIRRRGRDVDKTLRSIAKLLDGWKQDGGIFVLQNGLRADENVISAAFERRLSRSFSFPDSGYMDTGGLFIAEQVWSSTDPEIAKYRRAVIPQKHETLKSYFNRMTNMRIKNLSWKLGVIVDRYAIDMGKGEQAWHTAGYDALCLHHIVKHVGSRISESN